jgi:fatty-acyl-CoA synthase
LTAAALVTGLAGEVAANAVTTIRVLGTSGVVRPYSPLTLARVGKALLDYGIGPAGGFKALALRNPDGIGLVDELGELTFGEIERRGSALADSFRALGVGAGDGVAIMVRNHRGFVDATLAAAKIGADLVYLNTAFAGPQLVEVLEREGSTLVVYDEEFADLLADAHDIVRVVAWVESADPGVPTLEELIARGSAAARLPKPERPSRLVVLTSGTTGTPKGAPRNEAGVDAAVALLSRMPLRRGWTTHIAAPLFHTWGFAHLALTMLLESRVVLRRRFDPEDCLRTCAESGADSLVVIPVMLQRILRLPEETLHAADLSGLKVVAASGSALPGDLALDWMDLFGDTLYNIYGSTEVAYASVATPRDLRAAPGTAGKPPHFTHVRIYDHEGRQAEPEQVGRIFVGNGLLFEGYTGGGSKETIDGLMSTGDVGYFDRQGRLFVQGRDDEMIVSGGENVFPKEVEDCLTRHPAVHEAAAVGVDDENYGQRLRAFVVLDEGVEASEDDLKSHVREHLARYKVPREIVFLDELPRNATGKLLKRQLADFEVRR